MENIQIFLDAAEAYGVPKTSLFQTVDLYESRNMNQVINALMQLGTEVIKDEDLKNFPGICRFFLK